MCCSAVHWRHGPVVLHKAKQWLRKCRAWSHWRHHCHGNIPLLFLKRQRQRQRQRHWIHHSNGNIFPFSSSLSFLRLKFLQKKSQLNFNSFMAGEWGSVGRRTPYSYRCSSLRNVSFSPSCVFLVGVLYHQYNETFGPEAAPTRPGG